MFNPLPFLPSSLLLPVVLFLGISLPTHALADDAELEKEFMVALAADEAGDCDKALPLYINLADEGVPGAMINLGNMYLTGRCVEKDPKMALALLNVAVSYQTPVAHIHLSSLYYDGHLGVPDYSRASLHLSQGARMGLLNRALFAKMHYDDHVLDRELLEAEYILQEGIKAGDGASKTLLIEYYSDENGPLYDPDKAQQLK